MKRRYILTYLAAFGLAWLGYHTMAGAQQPLILPAEPGTGLAVPAAVFSAESLPGGVDQPKNAANFANPAARQEASVAFEWTGPTAVRVGQPNAFGLAVRNTSAIPVQQVVVRVKIPVGWTMHGTEPKAAADETVLVWEVPMLMPRQEKVFTMKMASTGNGDFTPLAWVTFTGAASMRVKATDPKLQVKVTGPERCAMGDGTAFVVRVTNPGEGAAERVRMKVQLSDGLDHARGRTMDFDVGTLNGGDVREVQILCAARVGGEQSCSVVAEGEGNLRTNDKATVMVAAASLRIGFVGPMQRYLDRKGTYVIEVENAGEVAAGNITVTDLVPPGLKFVAADNGGRFDPATQTVTWIIGEIAAGQTRRVAVDLVGTSTGEFTQSVAVANGRGNRLACNLTTKVEGLSAILLEVVDLADPVEVGGDVVYEIRITNTGTKTETNLNLTCIVPDKLAYKSATGPSAVSQSGAELTFANLPTLAPRADALYRVTCKALTPGIAHFKSRITSNILVEPVHKDEATRIYAD